MCTKRMRHSDGTYIGNAVLNEEHNAALDQRHQRLSPRLNQGLVSTGLVRMQSKGYVLFDLLDLSILHTRGLCDANCKRNPSIHRVISRNKIGDGYFIKRGLAAPTL